MPEDAKFDKEEKVLKDLIIFFTALQSEGGGESKPKLVRIKF